jgi:hypothetical protein
MLSLTLLLRGCAVAVLLSVVLPSFWQASRPAAQGRLPNPALDTGPARSPELRGIGVLPSLAPARVDLTTDGRRSLVVTDRAVLEHFSFAEVMAILTGNAADPGLSPLLLFRQWWAGQALPPCDDLQFGFPYACRPEVGMMATTDDPFSGLPPGSSYIPIGLFNRIDLAPLDGADCGEYRIVFGRAADPRNPGGRLLINFEAVLPNPTPALGLAGCRPVAEFWHGLTRIDDPAQRARQLRRFYFEGLAGFPPVVHREHYGARTCSTTPCATGQIRTNERLREPWMLREFRLLPTWSAPPRQYRVVPVRLTASPFGGLVCCESPGAVSPKLLLAFRQDLVRNVRSLARPDLKDGPELHEFWHDLAPRFDTGQGIAEARGESDLHDRFRNPSGDTTARDALDAALQAELNTVGSHLRPETVVGRLTALSCAGCHHISAPFNPFAANLKLKSEMKWPGSLGFEHVSELQPEIGPHGPRYRVSEAVQAFLPRRRDALHHVLRQ